MNVGPRDKVLLASLDFHMARISSFIATRSALVALKSSSKLRWRASWHTPYAISHSTLMFRTWSFVYSQTVGQPGQRASVNNTLGNIMDFGVHDLDISSGIPVPLSVGMGPVGVLLLNEGPHEIMHYYEFQSGVNLACRCS